MAALKRMFVVAAVVTAVVLLFGSALAGGMNSGGALDPNFGDGGLISTPVSAMGADSGDPSTVAVQPDGKIVVGGGLSGSTSLENGAWVIARYNADGSPDTSFGTNGLVSTCIATPPYAVCPGSWGALQSIFALPDGKLLAVGSAYGGTVTLVRYNPDGSLDSSFGTGGIALEQGFSGAGMPLLEPDGKIVVFTTLFGYNGIYDPFDPVVARFDPDGTLDPSFGTAGYVTAQPAPQVDPVACPPYSCDSGFEQMALGPNGTIVLSGWDDYAVGDPSLFASWKRYAFAERFSSDGTPDSSLGTGGVATVPQGTGDRGGGLMAVQSDGKILFANDHLDPTTDTLSVQLMRVNQDGSPDTTFGNNGYVIAPRAGGPPAFLPGLYAAQALLLQPDGKIVVVGSWSKRDPSNQGQSMAITRFTPTGSVDQGFGIGGIAGIDFGPRITAVPRTAILQPDGKILAVGTSWGITGSPAPISWIAMRYLPTGTTPLTVREAGVGTVDSKPLGISCGTYSCAAQFAKHSTVTLKAHPAHGEYVLWNGTCPPRTLTCKVTASTKTNHVNVTFALTPKFCLVPAATHKKIGVAAIAIQQNGCAVGKIINAPSATVPAGRVITQHPPAGVKKRTWSRVTLVVSIGKPLT